MNTWGDMPGLDDLGTTVAPALQVSRLVQEYSPLSAMGASFRRVHPHPRPPSLTLSLPPAVVVPAVSRPMDSGGEWFQACADPSRGSSRLFAKKARKRVVSKAVQQLWIRCRQSRAAACSA